MSAEEFLQKLERELHSLSAEERSSAMQYYREYLEDADDVDAAIRALGSPKKVAADIFRELGMVSRPVSKVQEMDRGRKVLLGVLLVCGLILCGGLLDGVATGILGVLVAIAAVILTFFLLFLVLAGALFVAAAACLVAIIGSATPLVALELLGAALVLSGLALFSFAAFLWMCRTVFPAIIRAAVSLGHRIFHPKGGTV